MMTTGFQWRDATASHLMFLRHMYVENRTGTSSTAIYVTRSATRKTRSYKHCTQGHMYIKRSIYISVLWYLVVQEQSHLPNGETHKMH